MKKLFLIILPFLLSYNSTLIAQEYIKIAGLIDPTILDLIDSKVLIIKVKEAGSKQSSGITLKTQISDNGRFDITFPTKQELQYLSFECITSGTKGNLGGTVNIGRSKNSFGLSENYLFEKGDSIYMHIRKGDPLGDIIEFSGRGSEKLNCQWQLFTTRGSVGGYSNRIAAIRFTENEFPKYVKLFKTGFEKQIELRMAILESYRTILKDDIYNLIYLDALSTAQYDALGTISADIDFSKSEENIQALKNLYDYVSGTDYQIVYDSISLNKSGYYADMLLKKYVVKAKLYRKTQKNSFKDIYNNIINSNSGYLRDKLLYLSYEELMTKFFEEAIATKEDVIANIKEEKYKNLVEQIYEQHSTIHPFELFDENDKVYNLTDFKGKVVVIDFWFTGCEPCALLAKAMEPIYERYKTDPNIVFITVSTDRKNVWIKSVKSGIYTAPGMLNLHTNGLGFQHPLIKNLKISSLPRQLILSKKNQIITSSPPRVDVSTQNAKEFCIILENTLKD